MSELATLEDVEKILYIPTWLYSNAVNSFFSDLNITLYIPTWLYSNQ